MYIGIDIGGTNIKGIIADSKGNIKSAAAISTGKTAAEIDNCICGLIEKLSEQKSIPYGKIKAIGIGTAGTIDNRRGIVITSPNIAALNNYPLAQKIKKRTGLRTFLENDATVAVTGEKWTGHGRNYRDWIILTLGTGIGGGAVINNMIYTGQAGSSMEFGHITIDYAGTDCPCGNKGCLETYCSATALVKLTGKKLKKNPASSIHPRLKTEPLTAKLVGEEAQKGDELAIAIFNEISTYLGIGIATLVNIFNPQAIIFGGGLSRAHRLILPVVKKVVMDRAMKGMKENIKYHIVKNEDKTPALGAAKVAMDNIYS